MMRHKHLVWALILSWSLVVMSGCSLFKKGGEAEDLAPIADASTDAIPQADPETPPPPADEAPAVADAQPPIDAPPADAAPPPPAPELAAAAPVETPQPPVSAPAPVAAFAAPSGETDTYTVSGGETLMKIAFDKYGDLYKWRDIYEANRAVVSDPNAVPAGTVLKLEKSTYIAETPDGEKYLIKRGDTLGTISGEVYGTNTKWRKIWDNNRKLIKDPNLIFAGFYLYYIPEAPGQLAPKDQRIPASNDPVQPVAPADPAAPAQTAPGA